MKEKIGIDIISITKLLANVRTAWTKYFWEFSYCQNKIRFSDEERTNYVSDLFSYFEDTLFHLSDFKMKDNYKDCLYDTVAVLQFMYIQQDMVDELLTLFGLKRSSNESKNPIRDIRNKLVGHPISRYNGKLSSSVFITNESKGSKISYAIYKKEYNFEQKIKNYSWNNIFEQHQKYLIENFNEILKKIYDTLLSFKNNLEEFLQSIDTKKIDEIVDYVKNSYEEFEKEEYLFKSENILYCYRNEDKHTRYRFSKNIYKENLKENISCRVEQIESYIFGGNKKKSQIKEK
jgi:hypothetical protein